MSLPPVAPEPGQEPNLYLLPCERCGEPRQHLFELVAEYPLCLWWSLCCGECGREVNAWEEVATGPRWGVAAPDADAT